MRYEVSALGRRVDLNLMVLFEAVYRTGNLTAAGRLLGLSQPAMSHALARLRWTFGDPLFLRLPRGMRPTPLADEIAPAVNEGLAVIRASFERKPFDPARSARIFTIAMGDLGEFVHLPRLLVGLHDAPGIRVRTLNVPPADRAAALAEGRIDLATANAPSQRPLRWELVGEHGYKVVARADHPLIGARATLAQFRKARHLLVVGTHHGDVVRRALRSKAVKADIAVEVGSFLSVATIVPRTDLVAVVPPGVARAIERMARVRVFDPPIDLPRASIFLWWHERWDRDAGNAWLRELYLKAVRPLYSEAEAKR